MRHRVCLIKDHELQLWHIAPIWMSGNLALCKLLDLLADHLDASLITSIELKDSLAEEVCSEQVLGKGEHS